MRCAALLLIAIPSTLSATSAAQYLLTIQQRWLASDLVCIGRATSPIRTGQWRRIDGADRDELLTDVRIESCLKGNQPMAEDIQVIGYDVVARKDITGPSYAYSGAPTGFVSEGRNLLFLRNTHDPNRFEVTVPIYATAIHLADAGVASTDASQPQSARFIVTAELEAAATQFNETDLRYFDYLLDYLGTQEGIAELSKFSQTAPRAVQRDAAVAVMNRGGEGVEPVVIALMLDGSAASWKRENAALALADHGAAAALEPLELVAAQSKSSDEQEHLHITATSSLVRLKHRLQLEQSR